MGGVLFDLTLITTFACLGLTLWFAIYLLSHSHANPLAFRAIVALGAVAFYYGYLMTALVAGTAEKSPVRLFAITLALIAVHDLTYYLLDPPLRKKRYGLARGIVMFGGVAIVIIFTALPPADCLVELVCPTQFSLPFLVVELFDGLIFYLIIRNLWSIKKQAGLLNDAAFYLAILMGIGSASFGVIGTLLNIAVPRLLPNIFILTALILLAISVARSRTFVTRRTSPYDLPITLAAIFSIVLLYLLAGWRFGLTVDRLILFAIVAIFTHSAYDFVRYFLDQLFHRQERQTRRELEAIGRASSVSLTAFSAETNATVDSFQHYLSRALAILVTNLNATCGFIATRQNNQFTVAASLHSIKVGEPFPSKAVAFEELAEPTSALFKGIAWLAPGYAGSQQMALIGIGPRKDKVPFDDEDLYWLEDIAHEIGVMIHLHQQPDNLQPGNFQEQKPESTESRTDSRGSYVDLRQSVDQSDLLSVLAYKPDPEIVGYIEDGYQHLNDYDELGKSPLVGLFGIEAKDHLERGKQVHNRLIQILEKLRPAGQPPGEPLPREWYAYTILHDSYVEDRLSRDIMSKLYIGEGTYYRLRRQALRGITRAVLEMGTI